MSALSIQPTYPIFTESDGLPLEDGYIWIGTANLDPQGNPINVYWDAALTQLAAQPIRTINGYPSNSGTPARLYVNSDYSIRVQDQNGSMVYSAPAATERYGNIVTAANVNFTGFKGQIGFVEDIADDDGSDWIGFKQSGIGSVAVSVQDKLRQFVSVRDFGAIGDGVVDDTTAIQNTINEVGASGGGTVYVPEGTYLVSAQLTMTSLGVTLLGAGRSTTILASADTHNIIKIGGTSSLPFRCGVKNLHLSGGNIAVWISYNSAQTILEQLYISGSKIGVQVKGDYTTNPIKDTINNHLYQLELENIVDYGIYLYMCGDIYISDVQTPSPQATAYGLVIDSGVTAVYADHINCTGGQGGILIVDNGGISPNPTSLPTTPRQMYFYQVQGDTCSNAGIQIEKAYQVTFVDSWGSGCTGGPGWVIGNGTSSIRQVALIGCRALGNYEDGFRWSAGNGDLGSQMIGCQALSNGYAAGGTYDGINVQGGNSGLVIQGCNAYNDDSQGLGIYQLHGINIEGNVTNLVITGNNLDNADGNTGTNLQYDSTTHTGNIITDNIGFNNESFASSPAMAASNTPFVNPYGRPMLVYINGGTVSAVKIDTITVATGTGYTAYIGPGHSISVVYSVAPSWSWVGM